MDVARDALKLAPRGRSGGSVDGDSSRRGDAGGGLGVAARGGEEVVAVVVPGPGKCVVRVGVGETCRVVGGERVAGDRDGGEADGFKGEGGDGD